MIAVATGAIAIVVVLAIVAIVGIIAIVGRNRHPPDDIETFRRRIDALSPEARRQTAERMRPYEPRPTDDDDGDER